MLCYFCQNIFQPVSVGKKSLVFNFVETDSTLTTAHYVSHTWRSFSTKAFVGSNGFLLSWIGKVLFESCANFWWTKLSRWRAYGKDIRKPMFFSRHVSLCCSYLAYYPVAGFPISVGDGRFIFRSFLPLADVFLNFHILTKIFCAQNEFSIDFLQNLNFRRFCTLQNHANHMNQKTVFAMLRPLSFDSSLHCERVSLFDSLSKSVK